MKREIQCGYCGHKFFAHIKKMYVIWLCDIIEMETKSESGEIVVIHDKNRIKTCGAFPTRAQADVFVIPDMEADQCKDVERIDTIAENYCASCRNQSKIFYDRLKARAKREAKERMRNRGVKDGGEAINPIDKNDYKKYLQFLVDSKIKQEYQAKEKALEEEKKKVEQLEAQNREKEAIERREKIIGGKPE